MSKSRKFRTKVVSNDDDEDQERAAVAPKDPAKKATKPSLLSFGDDEEGPIVATAKKKDKPKQPNASKFHQAGLKAPEPAGAAAALHRPAAGAQTHYSAMANAFRHVRCMQLYFDYMPECPSML